MASGVSSDPADGLRRGPQPDTVTHDLGLELERLVDDLEAELRQTGQISNQSADRLHEVRLKSERLFSERD